VDELTFTDDGMFQAVMREHRETLNNTKADYLVLTIKSAISQ